MKTAIVNKSDYVIATTYDGSADQSRYGGPWGDSSKYEHVEYDESTTGPYVKAQDNAGTTEIVEDIQPRRNAKLHLMRSIRNPKLAEVDLMCNDLTVGDRSDTAAVQLYRQQLKDITDAYKDSEDDNVGTAALDSLEDDLSDLAWPAKP